MADEPGRPRSSILRVDKRKQRTKEFTDKRTGGGYKKIFPDVQERLTFVAHQLDIAIDDYKSAYALTESSAPYLVFELQPSAIAKSHSALDVLNDCGLEVVATRTLEEKIVHGVEGAFKRLGGDLVMAAKDAPTDEQLKKLDAEDKEIRKIKREEKRLGKESDAKKTVHRYLPGGKFSWNEVAQFSTFRNVGFIRPEEKMMVPANFESAPVFVSTFPLCDSANDDIRIWITCIDSIIKKYKTGIRVLRANKKFMENIQEHASGLECDWNFKVNREYKSHQKSFVFLIENAGVKAVRELAGCEFVRTVALGHIQTDVLRASSKLSIPSPPAAIRSLPAAGLVDTGIASPSKLDPYITFRGGENTIRNKKVFHATDVAYLLVHNGAATPWKPDVAGLPCAIRDVARIDGGDVDGDQLRAAIWEATRDSSGDGTVNFSAYVNEGRRAKPTPEVSVFGELLDDMSLEAENLMIVCSAGNSGSVGMDSPADGVHVVSVGAFTRTPQGNFVRSDYSCHGGGIAHNAKPTFVVPVHDLNNKDSTWDTLIPSGSPGTSFAAPVATRVHAGLRHRGYNRDEALALMVHHAKHPGKDVYYKPSSKEIEEFGFGVVPSINECDPPDGSRITLIYDVPVKLGKFYELRLPIPQELSDYSAFARLTAYTRAPCSREMGEEYVAAEVPTHLRMYKKEVKKNGVPYVDLPPEPVDWKARYEEHRIKYGWKWGTLRRYSKTIRFGKYKEFALRIGPVIWRKWVPGTVKGQETKVQCVLSFYPLEGEAPPFFDFFRRAFVAAQVEVEVPLEVQIELEGES
ncbi:MAG: hypothetical protein A3G34_10735 [Candidatus Lindowbacteria bacterium RIFCSPLOWO2_12_FULL_62_27]|nr:MAG: hypothetical protein A3G34_10735 [Candidatus Lindowbacteria bacterium RIFCSPLOWO2_12_FULL_62_27]